MTSLATRALRSPLGWAYIGSRAGDRRFERERRRGRRRDAEGSVCPGLIETQSISIARIIERCAPQERAS